MNNTQEMEEYRINPEFYKWLREDMDQADTAIYTLRAICLLALGVGSYLWVIEHWPL